MNLVNWRSMCALLAVLCVMAYCYVTIFHQGLYRSFYRPLQSERERQGMTNIAELSVLQRLRSFLFPSHLKKTTSAIVDPSSHTANETPDFSKITLQQRLNISLLPSHSDDSLLYPDPSQPWRDRITTQLAYVPSKPPNVTKIMLIPGHESWSEKDFQAINCKVTRCSITGDPNQTVRSDLVLITELYFVELSDQVLGILTRSPRNVEQIWASWNRESPQNSRKRFGNLEFNWTLSYSPSSTIVIPYAQIYPITPGVTTLPQTRNFADNKTSKVLWFVSHCDTRNHRMDYVKELSHHIQVDIFGSCTGRYECTRSMGKRCMRDLLSKYKFYIAFENSNCDTYVTEKFFNNALGHDIIPIVMGALPAYYAHISPPHSYIHVEDYPSPAALADYLHTLDHNDTLYNEYFRWKGAWRIETIVYTKSTMASAMCRLCGLLHAPQRTTTTTHAMWSESEHCRKSNYHHHDHHQNPHHHDHHHHHRHHHHHHHHHDHHPDHDDDDHH